MNPISRRHASSLWGLANPTSLETYSHVASAPRNPQAHACPSSRDVDGTMLRREPAGLGRAMAPALASWLPMASRERAGPGQPSSKRLSHSRRRQLPGCRSMHCGACGRTQRRVSRWGTSPEAWMNVWRAQADRAPRCGRGPRSKSFGALVASGPSAGRRAGDIFP